MIDVWAVAANGLWVVGLALALAGWSWARWMASRHEFATRVALEGAGPGRRRSPAPFVSRFVPGRRRLTGVRATVSLSHGLAGIYSEGRYLDREVGRERHRAFDVGLATLVGMIRHPEHWIIGE